MLIVDMTLCCDPDFSTDHKTGEEPNPKLAYWLVRRPLLLNQLRKLFGIIETASYVNEVPFHMQLIHPNAMILYAQKSDALPPVLASSITKALSAKRQGDMVGKVLLFAFFFS